MGKNTENVEKVPEGKPAEGGQASQPAVEVNTHARNWSMLCHLAGLGWLLWWIVPLIGGIVGPLIVWQIKKDEDAFIDQNGKEALNFQISMLMYFIISGLLCFACIGFVLVPAVAIADAVFAIIASIKAGSGQAYKYPLTIRFIK